MSTDLTWIGSRTWSQMGWAETCRLLKPNPSLVTCRDCTSARPCRNLRAARSRMAEVGDELERMAALTEGDREWLYTHGWTGP